MQDLGVLTVFKECVGRVGGEMSIGLNPLTLLIQIWL